ncbi:MAG: hypothetical protein U0325_32935 [Polyangiales bacterium]
MRTRTLALLLGLSSWPATSAAQPRPLSAVVEARALSGLDATEGLALGVLGAGVGLRVAPALELRALAIALAPFGGTRDGREATAGGGGEFGMVLSPFPAWPVRPFLGWSVGLLFFPRRPFLPGGDVYEGLLSFGGGVEVPLSPRVTLRAQAQYAHLSNGQGLGPHNPAFDGVGGTLSVGWSVGPVREVPNVWTGAPQGSPRPRGAPGVMVDLAGGRVDNAWVALVGARTFWPLGDRAVGGVDVAAGPLVGFVVSEVGLTAALHLDAVTLGARLGYTHFAGFHTVSLHAQVEAHLSPEVSLLAMGAHARTLDGTSVSRAAVGLRAFPLRWLALELGVGFDRLGDPRLGDGSDPYLGVEVQLPVGAPDWQVSLFLERQVSTLDLVGVRVAWGMGPTLRDVARRTGWRPLR